VRLEPRVSALNVEELLSADISAETRFCHNESVFTDKTETDLVRNNRAVAVSNVRKRAGMD
jgi:hypothetical protein